MTDRKIRRKAIARHGSKIFGSRIARLIFASNLAGLAILIIGAMVLNEMRAGFVVSKKQDLVAQAQIFTSLLGDDATTPAPMLDDEAARQTIVRLNLPERVRARIYSPDGELVGDSFYLSERVDIDALPPLQEPSSFARLGANLSEWASRTLGPIMPRRRLRLAECFEHLVHVGCEIIKVSESSDVIRREIVSGLRRRVDHVRQDTREHRRKYLDHHPETIAFM